MFLLYFSLSRFFNEGVENFVCFTELSSYLLTQSLVFCHHFKAMSSYNLHSFPSTHMWNTLFNQLCMHQMAEHFQGNLGSYAFLYRNCLLIDFSRFPVGQYIYNLYHWRFMAYDGQIRLFLVLVYFPVDKFNIIPQNIFRLTNNLFLYNR